MKRMIFFSSLFALLFLTGMPAFAQVDEEYWDDNYDSLLHRKYVLLHEVSVLTDSIHTLLIIKENLEETVSALEKHVDELHQSKEALKKQMGVMQVSLNQLEEDTVQLSINIREAVAQRDAAQRKLDSIELAQRAAQNEIAAKKGKVVAIPDKNFEAFLLKHHDANNDGRMSVWEMEQIFVLDCARVGVGGWFVKKIRDFSGVEYCNNLLKIVCNAKDNPKVSSDVVLIRKNFFGKVLD